MLPDAAYVAIAEQASAALAVSDSSGERRVVWANRAALELLGLSREEVIGTALAPSGLRELHGADHWRIVIDDAVAAIDSDPVPARSDADQSRTWTDAVALDAARSFAIQVSVRAVPGGTAVVLLRPASDLQSLTEAKLSEAQHWFRALGEHAPIGIVVSEAGLRVGYVNAQFGQLVGQHPDDLTGIRWLRHVHEDDQPTVLTAIDHVLAGSSSSVVARLRTTDPDEARDAATTRWVADPVRPGGDAPAISRLRRARSRTSPSGETARTNWRSWPRTTRSPVWSIGAS